jgi:putative transposase
LIESVEDKGNTLSYYRFLCNCAKKNAGKKVYMVLDNVRFHHAKQLQPILEKYKKRIEPVFSPPYSPALNPTERVWQLMRKQVTHNRRIKSMEQRIDDFEFWCQDANKVQLISVCNLIENVY